MAEFRMPSLGADMDAGTLLEWHVAPGDRVHRGDIVASVDTSKAEIEIEIFEDGEIEELLVPPGTRVPVGAVLAMVRAADGAPQALRGEAAATTTTTTTTALPEAPVAAAAPAPSTAAAAPTPAPASAPPPVAPAPAAPVAARLRVSPLARRVAAMLGIDVAAVRGTGPARAVTRADVERAAGARDAATAAAAPEASAPSPPAQPSPAPAAPSPADRRAAMRHAIGALMARSKREVPHYYLETAIDLRAALDWLADRNAELAPADRLIPAALLLAATARAARAVPELNGFFVDGEVRLADRVHLGVAVALRGGGLVAPALHDADRATPAELMAALGDLATRARRGVLRSSEMTDATLTVTNLGDLGADKVLGVIFVPQVALVGFGAIRERPWASGGMLGVRPVVTATLSADHRASDGQQGSRLLAEIDRLLQHPETL